MKARDASMTLEEFRQYYDSHRGVISSVKAYDAVGRQWADADRLFRRPGAYTLIVVRFKNNTFLRVDVKPSLQVRLEPKKYSRAATWHSLGVSLTYEEKQFLEKLGDEDLTLDELVARIEASSFESKAALLPKVRRAAENMER